jgi:PAS domain-containing protein
MATAESQSSRNMARAYSGLNVALLACLAAAVCYLAAKLGGFLIIRDPQTLWPLWPGCAALVAILLVIPRKSWVLRLRLAVEAGRMYAFEWDAATDEIVRSGEYAAVLHWKCDPRYDTGREFREDLLPEDLRKYTETENGLSPEKSTYKIVYRVMRPGNGVVWMEENGRAFFKAQGRVLRTIGIVADITERKKGEEALSSVSQKLIEA